MTFQQIIITRDDREWTCRSVFDEDITEAIRAAGMDPHTFNRMKWPAGASNYGSCTVLLHSIDADVLYGGVDITTPLSLTFGGLLFDRMFALPPKPILCSEGAGVLYAVTLVDERYFWQDDGYEEEGFNVTLDDRDDRYTATLNASADWSIQDAIEALYADLVGDYALSEQLVTSSALSETNALRDLFTHGNPIPRIIDALAALGGYVVRAVPNTTLDEEEKRYRTVAIADGDDAAQAFAAGLGAGHLLAGGFVAFQGSTVGTNGAELRSFGLPQDLRPFVPDTVRVLFPKAVAGGTGYIFNQANIGVGTGAGYVVDRWNVKTSSFGRPVLGGNLGNGETITLYDSTWAIHDGSSTADNDAALQTRANAVATIYYARFKAGIGKTLWRGIIPFAPWAGCHDIEWIIHPSGPLTRIEGDFNHRLFGWTESPDLTRFTVHSIGRVRSMPRPDGSILLDVPNVEAATNSFLASITVDSNITPNEKWSYTFVEVWWTGSEYEALPGGRSGTCESTHEDIDPDLYENIDCSEVTPPEGTVLAESVQVRMPMPDRVVTLTETPDSSGNLRYTFDEPNPYCTFCIP